MGLYSFAEIRVQPPAGGDMDSLPLRYCLERSHKVILKGKLRGEPMEVLRVRSDDAVICSWNDGRDVAAFDVRCLERYDDSTGRAVASD